MASLLTAPYSQLFDNNGAPLAGGKVYTYAAGTTTPQSSYTDSSAGTAAANPVILDSAGRAAIWLSGSYKIIVKDANDVQIGSTVDSITSQSASSSTFSDSAFLVTNSSDATKKIALSASGLTTGTTRIYTAPDKNGTLALTSDIASSIKLYQVTDTTDIVLSDAPTQSNVGSTKSITIPTKGRISLIFTGELITVNTPSLILGIRIGSTNYWNSWSQAGSTVYGMSQLDPAGTSVYKNYGSAAVGATSPTGGHEIGLGIEELSIPTGVQTVQVIAARSGASITMKGTVVTSRIYITVFDHT